MQYLLEDARLLFTLLLLSATAVLVLLFSMAHRISARIKARKENAAQASKWDDMVLPQACCPGGSAPCCPAGACRCK